MISPLLSLLTFITAFIGVLSHAFPLSKSSVLGRIFILISIILLLRFRLLQEFFFGGITAIFVITIYLSYLAITKKEKSITDKKKLFSFLLFLSVLVGLVITLIFATMIALGKNLILLSMVLLTLLGIILLGLGIITFWLFKRKGKFLFLKTPNSTCKSSKQEQNFASQPTSSTNTKDEQNKKPSSINQPASEMGQVKDGADK